MRKQFLTAFVISAALLAGLAPQTYGATQLTTKQKAELKYLIEEEKLARDVYAFLADKVTSQKFSNITKSEQTHMDLVSNILKQYGIKNPTKNMAAGEFKNQDLQGLYKKLTSEGTADILSAYQVGVQIEELDIADLKDLMKITWPADVKSVLDKLLSGSQNHLLAFTR